MVRERKTRVGKEKQIANLQKMNILSHMGEDL